MISRVPRVTAAVAEVVAPTLRLNGDDELALSAHAVMFRYGAGELIQEAGDVPAGMTFIVSGDVQLTALADDGSLVVVDDLEEGAFLGQTTLTRQPLISSAYAVNEVTVVFVERDVIATVVQQNPVLMQELGRTIEERRANVVEALTPDSE